MQVKIKRQNNAKGTVKISGSKNACLPILSLSLLTNEKIILYNVPMISDVFDMLEILKKIGVKTIIDRLHNKVTLKRKKIRKKLLIKEVSKIRASYYVIPGMLSKNKKVRIRYPGGCSFSNRPIDYHLNALRQSGSRVFEKENEIEIIKSEFKNNTYSFPRPSVGVTINSIMLSVLSSGKSTIIDQSLEPEIVDFINCLITMGADIKITDNKITIEGGKKLKGTTYKIMPDRIELGSYIMLTSAMSSDVELTNINTDSINYLLPIIDKLEIKYILKEDSIEILGNEEVKNIDLIIDSYPNFPTDLQPIVCTLLFLSNGKSTVIDKVYPDRLSHISELNKMKGKIINYEKQIIIKPSVLEGCGVEAHDLRCGFALLVAGAIAEGETTIKNFEVVNRGYENIIDKFKSIGITLEILKK